jgi:hypothetical protein
MYFKADENCVTALRIIFKEHLVKSDSDCGSNHYSSVCPAILLSGASSDEPT